MKTDIIYDFKKVKYLRESINSPDQLQNHKSVISDYTNYNFYFGIPHAHTSYSDGKGIPLEAYEYAKSKGLDFLIIADHSNFLDGVKDVNYEYDILSNQYIEKLNSQWHRTRLEAEIINHKYSDFIAFRGFEMSTKEWGHINVINSENYVEGKKQIKSMKEFFDWLKTQNNIVASLNHPGGSFKNVKYVTDLDGIINLIEVGNGAYPRKYRRLEKCYYKALDMGWHLGAVNGQDNHIDNWGDDDNLTVVLSEELSKEKILNALKCRRCYSTESRSLKLIFNINSKIMGEILKIKSNENLRFNIVAEDLNVPIQKVQIITDNGKIFIDKTFSNSTMINWSFDVLSNMNYHWFVVKIIHANGKWGISSPIFLETN
jgi:hypothetical protein